MFASELEMSKYFEKFLKENFGNTYFKELQGLFGIPDFVFYAKNGHEYAFVSFELKLKNWKQAAKQAFRHKSFSNVSYVVMESNTAKTAIKNIDFFKQYNIGLATFDYNKIFEIHFKPKLNEPYSGSLKQKLVDTVTGTRKRAKNIETLFG